MIVVTGATGKVGGEVVRLLAAAGERVTALSRRPATFPEGVRHSAGDLAEPDTLKDAFTGADALFLLVAGDEPRAVLDLARTSGIRRIVLLSSQGAGTRPHAYGHPVAFEEAVRDSGLDWTILRPGGFATNSLAWAEPIRAHRTAAAPFGDVALPVIDPADIAEVAATVLRQPGHAGRTYELTGPRAITPRERASAIGRALGTEVRFVEQTRQEAGEAMSRFMPQEVVEGTLAILGTPVAAEQRISPDVERILGRAPRAFADWAARNASAFRP
ncbi:NAD(P)H-binding protein [Nonomuraea sp. SBT364]|uniref:NAD(P)H-binding protein n=1 Tax=Nonomuraea sp. SBT364 TaxID=1580530 RepID=UPI00066DB555|nr:NAD(P)H-binding protein [Nonomuraea sp. SBT364]